MLRLMRIKVKKNMVMSNNNHIEIIIEDGIWQEYSSVEDDAYKVFDVAVGYLQEHDAWSKFNANKYTKPFNINLVLANAEEVHQLNKEFRGIDKTTNVLSFANVDADDFEEDIKNSEIIELGDIIIAYEVLAQEAEIKKIPFSHHFMHLLVHGILHLMGYDHQEDTEAEVMEGMEKEILALVNVDNPYEEFTE